MVLAACAPPPPGTTVSEGEATGAHAFGRAIAREQGIGLLDYALFGQNGLNIRRDTGTYDLDGVSFSTNFTNLSGYEETPEAGIDAGFAAFCAKSGGKIVATARETAVTTKIVTRSGLKPRTIKGTFDFCNDAQDRVFFGYRIVSTRDEIAEGVVRYLLTTAEPVSDQAAIQALYETMKLGGQGTTRMTEDEKRLRAREFETIAFGDQLCLLAGQADVYAIVENKAKGRFQLRIQKSNDPRYAIGNIVWGEQKEWGDCGLLAYR